MAFFERGSCLFQSQNNYSHKLSKLSNCNSIILDITFFADYLWNYGKWIKYTFSDDCGCHANTKHKTLIEVWTKIQNRNKFQKIFIPNKFCLLVFFEGKDLFNGTMLKFVSVKGLVDSSRGSWKQNERLMLSLLHYQFEVLKLLIEEQSHIWQYITTCVNRKLRYPKVTLIKAKHNKA